MPRGIYNRSKAKARSRSTATTSVAKRSKRIPVPVEIPEPLSLRYRHDQWSGTVRVWRTDWAGDQFEVLSVGHFEQLKYWTTRFSIPLIKAEENDDE